MAGFGAAHRLHEKGRKPIVLEKASYHGGHAASFRYDEGFIFDDGPHISFTANERIKRLFAESVEHEYFESRAYVNNYWKGHWIKHPAQCNLHNLPVDLVTRILCDFIEANSASNQNINNYEDWLRAAYGNAFAETFPMEYTKKFHTTEAKNLSTDWVAPRLYKPSLEEVLRGALAPNTSDVHYVTSFRYPKRGGFVSYLNGFLPRTDLRLRHGVQGIDPRRGTLTLENGDTVEYSGLVSSIPLPELIPLISGTPKDVLEAAGRLACSELVVVNLGIGRPEVGDAHWTYFYDKEIFVTRISTPHLQSIHNVPPGCASIQAECYFSRKYRPLDRPPEECIDPVIDDLKRCGLLAEDEPILFRNAIHIPYANVIFDLERAANLAVVHGYLKETGIFPCGRYGLCEYIWTDESFESGEAAAERMLEGKPTLNRRKRR